MYIKSTVLSVSLDHDTQFVNAANEGRSKNSSQLNEKHQDQAVLYNEDSLYDCLETVKNTAVDDVFRVRLDDPTAILVAPVERTGPYTQSLFSRRAKPERTSARNPSASAMPNAQRASLKRVWWIERSRVFANVVVVSLWLSVLSSAPSP